MDRAQDFIKKNLFSRNFTDPEKPINENRLRETLLVLPTDGGITSRLKQNRSKLKLHEENIISKDSKNIKHPNYKRINKNSKTAMYEYISACRKSCKQAKRIAHEQGITSREQLYEYLKENKHDLWEKIPRYESYLPMYEMLWVGYIKEILGLPTDRDVKDPSKITINGSSALLKLSMAEYNGSILRVTKSQNKNLIGVEGIVIWDGQKTFIMIKRGQLVDEVKCIPKKGTVFNFEVPINDTDALQYTILGDRFKYRSSDRAGRKFKSRRCDDMIYYIE